MKSSPTSTMPTFPVPHKSGELLVLQSWENLSL